MKLIIKRKDGFYTDKIRAYKILINRKKYGVIKAGQTIEINLTNGIHRLKLKIDWCSSKTLLIRGDHDDSFVAVVCYPRKTPHLTASPSDIMIISRHKLLGLAA